MNAVPAQPPGWFGKLPALGDFVTRRLPQSFVRPWDQWLTRGVEDIQRTHSEVGREALLTFPIWRFVAPPGTIGDDAWLGVLAPSVDSVGRCFPLTIAGDLPPARFARLRLSDAAGTLERWARALTSVLEDDDVDAFDATLRAAPLALAVPAESAPGVTLLAFHTHGSDPTVVGAFEQSFSDALTQLAGRELLGSLGSRILWWTEPQDTGEGLVLVSERIDSAALFEQLLGIRITAPDSQPQPQPTLFGDDR